MKRLIWASAAALLSAAAGCDSARASARSASPGADSVRADSIARARQDSINRAQPGYVIDSILPVEEELRRFRAAIGGAPATTLEHASPSRDVLIRRIVDDVARGDSLDLRAAAITAREYADLVYPSSPFTHPPYRQSPGLAWMQIAGRSASGYTRLLKRREGQRLALANYSCVPKAEVQGDNRLWSDCVLRLVGAGRDTSTQRWFGSIVERQGRFKLISFANQF
jgi:hypothetical protein